MLTNLLTRFKNLFAPAPPAEEPPGVVATPADVTAVAARLGAGQIALTSLRCVAVRDERGAVCYEIEPRDLYAVAVPALVHVVNTHADPGGALGNIYRRAVYVPAEAWEWATWPNSVFERHYTAHSPEAVERGVAMFLAQRWFVEHLHQETGGNGAPMHLKILKDLEWKAYVPER